MNNSRLRANSTSRRPNKRSTGKTVFAVNEDLKVQPAAATNNNSKKSGTSNPIRSFFHWIRRLNQRLYCRAVKTLPERAQKLLNRIGILRPHSLIVLFVIAVTTWLVTYNANRAIRNLEKSTTAILGRGLDVITNSLVEAKQVNLVNARDFQSGRLNVSDVSALRGNFLSEIQCHDRISIIGFGLPNGDYYAVDRLRASDSPRWVIRDRQTTSSNLNIYALGSGDNLTLITNTGPYASNERPWFKAAPKVKSESKQGWSEVYQYKTQWMYGINTSTYVYDKDEQLLGVATTSVSLSRLSDYLEQLKKDFQCEIFIMDADGLLVASSTRDYPFNPEGAGGKPATRKAASEGKSDLVRQASKLLQDPSRQNTNGAPKRIKANDGKHYIVAAAPLNYESLHWKVVIINSSEELNSIVHIILLSFVVSFFATAIVLWRQEIKRREAEARLREAKRVAELADKGKTEFLNRMRHDIINPLDIISVAASEVRKWPLSPEQSSCLHDIKTAAGRVGTRFKWMLNAKAITAGQIEVVIEPFNLGAELNEVVTANRLQASLKKQVVMEPVQYGEDVPPVLMGDQWILGDILFNLLHNAIKFTDNGKVTLSVTRDSQPAAAPDQVYLKFSVQDTGRGIPADKLESIFTVFERVDNSMRTRESGSGLGLSMVKAYVKKLGGEIKVESERRKGSTFYFTVPFLVPAAQPAESGAPVESGATANHFDSPGMQAQWTAARRILVVDDDILNLRTTLRTIRNPNWAIQSVDSGKAALEIVKRSQFDLVLMDIAMPHIDGIQATRFIRELDAEKQQSTWIIGLTAYHTNDFTEKARKAGMNSLLNKPVRIEELLKTLDSLSSLANAAVDGATSDSTEWKGLKKPLESQYQEDPDLFADNARGLFPEATNRLKDLENAVKLADAVAVKRITHSLVGPVAFFKMPGLPELVKELAASGHNGDLKNVEVVSQQTAQRLALLQKALEEILAETKI